MNPICYYEVLQEYDNLVRVITPLGLPKRPDGLPTDLLRGIPVVVPTPKVFEFDIDPKENQEPPHFIRGRALLVVSDKFLKALRQAGVGNFEIWPAILRDPKTKREWENYYLFNEIGLLDAVLLEESDHDTIIGGNGGSIPSLIGFHKVVFDAKKTNGEKMFRIPQCETDLYMSWDVVKVLIQLSPPEKWGIRVNKIELR
jgi:hypothetical protein